MRIHEPMNIRLDTGETLRGDLRFADVPGERAIVFVHGFASRRDGEKSVAMEEACAKTGWTFAAIDCRGHGESDGSMRDLRPSRLIEDLTALQLHLATRGIRDLYIVGSSMGGFASAWFALDCDAVKACIMLAPAFRFLERRWEALTEFEREYWKRAGFVRYKNEHVDTEVGYGLMEERHLYPFDQVVSRWTKPALIFHGLADDVVPIADSLEFQNRAIGTEIELRIYKNGDHRLTAYKEEMAAEACRFFSRVAERAS